MSDLVTGEAVVLGLPTAKLPTRALARALDFVIQVVGLVVTLLVLAGTVFNDTDEAAQAAIELSVTIFYWVGLPVLVEVLSKGRSLGKLVFGLRVVRVDGGPSRFRHALVRGLVGMLEFVLFFGVPAVITSLFDERGRRLGDIFCGSMVIRERLPSAARTQAPLPPVPPQLLQAIGGELVALDLSAVPSGLWLAIRQFLGRLGQLDPAVAAGMAQRLLGDLVAYTGHAAPAQVSPVAYLGAVLTERQRRDWARESAAMRQQMQQMQPTPPARQAQPMQSAPQPQPAPVAAPAAATAAAPQEQSPVGNGGGFAPPA